MIRTDQLTKRYGDTTAVDHLDVEVPAGSVVGVIGPNGAGKTTLLRLLLGLVPPTSGGGAVLGRDLVVESVAIRRRTALVPESKALYRGASAGDFVGFYAGFFPAFDHGGAMALLERWGVDAEVRSEALSHGSRSKVLLAAALGRDADLLLLDEPSEGLDPSAVEDLWGILMRRVGAPEGAGVVLSTHRLDEVERVCDRVVVMDRGRLVLEGEIDELRSRWRRVTVRARGSEAAADPEVLTGAIPGRVAVRDRAGLVEATTSAWDPGLPERLAPDAEIVEVREMGMREIYLEAVGHER